MTTFTEKSTSLTDDIQAPSRKRIITSFMEDEVAPSVQPQIPVLKKITTSAPVIVEAFTTDAEIVMLHYNDDPEIRSYVHCNGDGCLLCKLGYKTDDIFLMPIFDLIDHKVVILSVRKANSSPKALRPQLMAALKAPKSLIEINRIDNINYTVSTRPLSENLKSDPDKINAFVDAYNNETIDISEFYPRMTDEFLSTLSTIQKRMAAKGITS